MPLLWSESVQISEDSIQDVMECPKPEQRMLAAYCFGIRCLTSTIRHDVRVYTVHICLAMYGGWIVGFTSGNITRIVYFPTFTVWSPCCDDLIVAPPNCVGPYFADLNTAVIMQNHTLPLCRSLAAPSSSIGQEKGFDFLFNLACAWRWDGFQNSLSPCAFVCVCVCVSHSLSSCLLHTC